MNGGQIKSQANIGASDSFDDFSSKSLDASLNSSKNIGVELEPKNSNTTSDSNEMLGTIKTKDLEIKFLGQRITTLKEKNFVLETEMSNLETKIADECAHASVSPRCEENNVLSDRVKILELENLSLNKVIKNFTSSQQNLNKLVGNLGIYSFGHGVGFQRDVIRTKPKRSNLSYFKNFLRNPTSYYDSDVECLNAKLNVKCHYCSLKGHVSHDCVARINPSIFSWIPKMRANIVGTKKSWLPVGVSFSAGASTSSNK